MTMAKTVLARAGRIDLRGRQFIIPLSDINELPESNHKLADVGSICLVVEEHVKHTGMYRCVGECHSEGARLRVVCNVPTKDIERLLGMLPCCACLCTWDDWWGDRDGNQGRLASGRVSSQGGGLFISRIRMSCFFLV